MIKTQIQIAQSIISTVSGGIFVDERNLSQEKILDKIDEVREVWVAQKFKETHYVHPDWVQKFWPEYDEDIQDASYCVKFKCPSIARLSDRADGLRYIGAEDCADDFRRVKSRGQLSTMRHHPAMKVGNKVVALYESGVIELISKRSKPFVPIVIGIFSKPSEIPTFNINTDQYPLDGAGIEFVENYIVTKVSRVEISTPADGVSNSAGPITKK